MAHSLTQQVRSFVRVGDNDSAEHPGEFAQHGRDYMICVPLEVGSHDSCEPAACFAKVGSAALLQEQVGHGRFADVTKSVRAAEDSALRRGGGGGEFVAANSSPSVCSAAAVHCGHHPSPRPSLGSPNPPLHLTHPSRCCAPTSALDLVLRVLRDSDLRAVHRVRGDGKDHRQRLVLQLPQRGKRDGHGWR